MAFHHCTYVLSEDEMLKWVPLIGLALSENLTNDSIQGFGIDIFEGMVNKIDHQKLLKTTLPTALGGIIQSEDATDELKEKCRTLVKAIYS
mmetsp:Transcript_61229/g.149895  ORF Transcript_61229/g.149895 Transcript_61229/m.149895 type:complete len:91 (+) Transcript_61229:850-1122(+)